MEMTTGKSKTKTTFHSARPLAFAGSRLAGCSFSLQFDADALPLLRRWTWRIVGYKGGRFYLQRSNNGKTFKFHRQLIDAPPGYDVDHINGDSLDNRRLNLRVATRQQNLWNSKKHFDGKNTFKGVYFNSKTCKYRALIYHKGKQFHIGTFNSELDAVKAYDRIIGKMRGVYARKNVYGE